MNWWQERCVNRRDFILDHLEERDLNTKEALCLILIDFFNQYQISISHERLAEKLKLPLEQVDELLSALQDKGYLHFGYNGNRIAFDIDVVLEESKPETLLFHENLFALFEKEFARPISQREMERLSEWLHLYDEELIVLALREALIQGKTSFDYINRILMNWKAEGKQASSLMEG